MPLSEVKSLKVHFLFKQNRFSGVREPVKAAVGAAKP
jgi:hypothetical protein